ncbi:histidinol-phosphate transaminase [Flavobacterium sp.]|uniref:histidinol-phosphate transaminase n=1 Tax=Flavobacterium sp. TaxID=239 RepID=UPI0025C2C327|nr:histidinol-phosphate transaminase [Flavobacterium sp.]
MSYNIVDLVRPNIKKMQSYSSARDEFKEGSESFVFLDANESPVDNGINRYPDPQQKKLKEVISKRKGIDSNQLLLGNGSDEVLDLLFRAFCEPNIDNVITLPPTYGMYAVLANLNAVENREVLLDSNFEPNVDGILKAIDDRTKIVFLCSPNNPTGNTFSRERIEKILSSFSGLVVIDEAYIDFSEKMSWLSELELYPNLIICQTLSKAYGMAGLRIGSLFASADIISILNKIKPPYNINVLSQEKAFEELLNINKLKKTINSIKEEKDRLIKVLLEVSFVKKVYPSDTNYLLIEVDDALKRYDQLLKNGIVVRNRSSQPLCTNSLRITIGTSEENDKLIQIIKQL